MKKTILYFYSQASTFVKKDIEIFEKKFLVKQFWFNVLKKIFLPFSMLKQSLFLLINIRNSTLLVCQFGGYHSFLPSLFARLSGKKSLIITGGVDYVSYPSFNYGYLHKFPLGIFTKWSYRLATHIAPKHESLILAEDSYYGIDFPKQGIKYFISQLKTPYTVIYNGYDIEKWKCIAPKKKNNFITVSGGFEYPFQLQLKGIDLIFEVARVFPNCEFQIIGVPENSTIKPPYPNIIFIPPQPNHLLAEYYSKAEFYLQLSISEGFPNALCEAMVCECVPVVSNVGAMPEIIGDSGFILEKRNISLLTEVLGKALKSDRPMLANKAGKRIADNYSLENREKKLLALALNVSEGKD